MEDKSVMKPQVGLFFYVNGRLLFHGCELAEAESYGDFLVYPDDHMEVWNRRYFARCRVDFDYFPRGRVVYRKSDGVYFIYHDQCLVGRMGALTGRYAEAELRLTLDEHYQCRRCNPFYVV